MLINKRNYTERQRNQKNKKVDYLLFYSYQILLFYFFLDYQQYRATNVGPVDYIRMFSVSNQLRIIIFL